MPIKKCCAKMGCDAAEYDVNLWERSPTALLCQPHLVEILTLPEYVEVQNQRFIITRTMDAAVHAGDVILATNLAKQITEHEELMMGIFRTWAATPVQEACP